MDCDQSNNFQSRRETGALLFSFSTKKIGEEVQAVLYPIQTCNSQMFNQRTTVDPGLHLVGDKPVFHYFLMLSMK